MNNRIPNESVQYYTTLIPSLLLKTSNRLSISSWIALTSLLFRDMAKALKWGLSSLLTSAAKIEDSILAAKDNSAFLDSLKSGFPFAFIHFSKGTKSGFPDTLICFSKLANRLLILSFSSSFNAWSSLLYYPTNKGSVKGHS